MENNGTIKERWLRVCEFNRALTLAEIEKEQIKEEDCFTEYQEVDSEQEDNDNKDK